MNWKEFFKFTKTKIIITIIVIVVSNILHYGLAFLLIMAVMGLADPLIHNVLEYFGTIVVYLIKPFSYIRFLVPIPHLRSLIGLLGNLLYHYFLSCLIFYLYNKFKKRS